MNMNFFHFRIMFLFFLYAYLISEPKLYIIKWSSECQLFVDTQSKAAPDLTLLVIAIIMGVLTLSTPTFSHHYAPLGLSHPLLLYTS